MAEWKGLLCRDCNKFHDIYMVRHPVWAEACPEDPKTPTRYPEGFYVCLECVSIRLKRQLTPADFDFSIPCNMDNEEIKAVLNEEAR